MLRFTIGFVEQDTQHFNSVWWRSVIVCICSKLEYHKQSNEKYRSKQQKRNSSSSNIVQTEKCHKMVLNTISTFENIFISKRMAKWCPQTCQYVTVLAISPRTYEQRNISAWYFILLHISQNRYTQKTWMQCLRFHFEIYMWHQELIVRCQQKSQLILTECFQRKKFQQSFHLFLLTQLK